MALLRLCTYWENNTLFPCHRLFLDHPEDVIGIVTLSVFTVAIVHNHTKYSTCLKTFANEHLFAEFDILDVRIIIQTIVLGVGVNLHVTNNHCLKINLSDLVPTEDQS